MKKGLIVALMTATAVFLHASNGFAIAPVVSDPGDMIIGDLEVVTGGGVSATRNFVYADVEGFNILTLADDADDDAIDLIWSFASGEYDDDGEFVGAGTDTININGVGPLDPGLEGIGSDDPTQPSASRTITHDGATDVDDVDGDAATLTFRNTTLLAGDSRLSGTDGQVVSTETLTLFASDGTTFGWRSVTVFTANGTSDSKLNILDPILDDDYTAPTTTDPSDPGNPPAEGLWFQGDIAGGNTSTEFIAGRGLCVTHIRGSATESAQGGWVTPAGFLDLVDGSVYRVRMTVSGSETDATQMPLFNLVYNNNNADPATGATVFNFGGEMIIQPAIADINASGGNNAGDTAGGRQTFDSYVFPFAGDTPQWNAMFAPEIGALGDMSLLFRLNQGGAQPDRTGQVCLAGFEISSTPLSTLSGTTVFNSAIVGNNTDSTNAIDAGTFVATGTFAQSSATGDPSDTETTVLFGGGTATVNLRSDTTEGGSAIEILPYAPSAFQDFSDAALLPITWESDQLYDSVWTMSSSGVGTSPVDVMIGIFKAAENEISASHFSLSGLGETFPGHGSANGTPADFHSLFFSHTASPTRPVMQTSIQFFNSPSLGIGGPGTATGNEDVIIHGLEVIRIDPSTFGGD